MVAFILEFPVRLKLASFKSDLRELKRLNVHVLYALGERELKISRVIGALGNRGLSNTHKLSRIVMSKEFLDYLKCERDIRIKPNLSGGIEKRPSGVPLP